MTPLLRSGTRRTLSAGGLAVMGRLPHLLAALEQHEPVGKLVADEGRAEGGRAPGAVRPALVVHGNDGPGAEDLRRRGGALARQREGGAVAAVGASDRARADSRVTAAARVCRAISPTRSCDSLSPEM